jgi:hypothetical protein
MYLGFDRPLLAGVSVSLAFQLLDARDGESESIRAEADAQSDCRPPRPDHPCRPCPPTSWCAELDGTQRAPASASGQPATLLRHHSARLVWEYRALDHWRPLSEDTGDVVDPTRSFSLGGVVRVRVPGPMAAIAVGALPEQLHWLRCRFVAGDFDDAPVVIGPLENAAPVTQQVPSWQRFEIAPGAVINAQSTGQPAPLDFGLDEDARITALQPGPADGRPEVRVLELSPAGSATPWITLDVEHVLTGSGWPSEMARLSGSIVAEGAVELFGIDAAGWESWQTRVDLDASGPHDRHFTVGAEEGVLRFGDGRRGRVVPDGTPMLARYCTTRGSEGDVREGISWIVDDNPWNRALLAGAGHTVATANARLVSLQNPVAARGGAQQESLESVERRAAETLWAHERLVQLLPAVEPVTLDQSDRSAVRARSAPSRATTIADFERLAVEVPGTRVRRARAWANLDPDVSCLDAPGTVTVVIVPALPRERPQPGAGLLRAVRRFLDRRRVLGTRLIVTGPRYLTVEVRARVRAHRTADPLQVRSRVDAALRDFLDPLRGGPARLGWPFGRDVFRSEVMAVIDRVAGVDHVIECNLTGDGTVAVCDNLCVPPTWLVTSGSHGIDVVRP